MPSHNTAPIAGHSAAADRTVSAMNTEWDESERAALVALLRTRPRGLSWAQLTAEVGDLRSALAVWNQLNDHQSTLFSTDEDADEPLERARADVAKWRQAAFRFLTFRDPDYPAQLRDVSQVPPVLFTRGTLCGNDRGVCVVGSRQASRAALQLSRSVAEALVHQGITVVSGLAAGIDATAHRAALDANGRTVAVIGTGIDHYYPADNRELQDEIARDGLLVSQFWPDSPPAKQNFPMRNAVMSAYGRATVVIEAGEHSGARVQARLAVAHGRPVILADAVVRGTKWGNALVGQPGVFWARDPDETIARAVETATIDDRIAEILTLGGQ